MIPTEPPTALSLPSVGAGLENRSRVLLTFGFVIAVNLVPDGHWWLLAGLTGFLGSGVAVAGIPVGRLLRRSLPALPFLMAALVIPVLTPGPVFWEIPGTGWAVSRTGLERLAGIVWRFGLSVQAAAALTLVTPFPELLQGLGRLRFPPVLIAIIGMMHRYLAVIGDEAQRMMRARNARIAGPSGGRKPRWAWQVRVAGLMIGSLFLRSFERSERIHLAMLSRGFDGTFRCPAIRHLRLWDGLAIGGIVLLVVLIGLVRWW